MGWTCPHCGSDACMTECKTIAEREAEIARLRIALAAAEAREAVLMGEIECLLPPVCDGAVQRAVQLVTDSRLISPRAEAMLAEAARALLRLMESEGWSEAECAALAADDGGDPGEPCLSLARLRAALARLDGEQGGGK